MRGRERCGVVRRRYAVLRYVWVKTKFVYCTSFSVLN